MCHQGPCSAVMQHREVVLQPGECYWELSEQDRKERSQVVESTSVMLVWRPTILSDETIAGMQEHGTSRVPTLIEMVLEAALGISLRQKCADSLTRNMKKEKAIIKAQTPVGQRAQPLGDAMKVMYLHHVTLTLPLTLPLTLTLMHRLTHILGRLNYKQSLMT